MKKYSYECIIALDTGVTSGDSDALFGKLKQLVESGGGVVLEVQKPGNRRLAFKVKGKTDATIFNLVYDGSPDVVKSIEGVLRLNEGVLRYMTTVRTGPVAAEQTPAPGAADQAA